MTKRQKLTFNSDELTQNLKASTGQGMDAFFPKLPPTPSPSSLKETKPTQRAKQTPPSKHARTRPHTQPKRSTSASTLPRNDAQVHARTIDELKRAILNKKRLSSFTFRFKAEELETLDTVTKALN